MANESVQAISADKLTDLAIHNYAMDSDTACSLHQVEGILDLVRDALDGVRIDEPVPSGIQCSIWAAHDILREVMVKGGIRGDRA